MKPLRPGPIAIAAAVATVAGWLATVFITRAGGPTPVLPLSSLLTVGILTLVTVGLGIYVLRWRLRRSKRMVNPLLAARTVVLAQATAFTGAMLGGWHAGILIEQLTLVTLRSNQSIFWLAIGQVVGGVMMVIAGFVVERFCRIPPENTGADTARPDEGEYA